MYQYRGQVSKRLNDIIGEALDATSSIESEEFRLEAFKIILSRLIDSELGVRSSALTQADHVPKVAAVETAIKENDDNVVNDGTNEIPMISSAGSAPGNVMVLFDTSWGQKRRTVDEVRAALDANNVPDPKIAQTLKRLAEQKKLRSFKHNGKLVYWKNPDYKPE